ncbi:MAG: cell division protein FtsA [Candidatus Ratteibacteria bacterium]|jgi:cell division protein FtsA
MAEPLSAIIDFGTSKLFGVVGIRKDDRIEIIGSEERLVESDQVINHGKVVDLQGLTQNITELLGELETQVNRPLPFVHILIGGGFIEGNLYSAEHTIEPPKREINRSDTELFLKSIEREIHESETMSKKGSIDYRILHLVPQEYVIDGESHVRKNPEGMYGNTVKAKIHCLVSLTNPLQNFIQCVKNARSSVEITLPHSWGCGELLLSEEEKNLGCLLVDFGKGTTDYLLYIDGLLVKTGSIPISGFHIDNDLSRFLNTPISYAEELKKKYGWCNVDLLGEDKQEEMAQQVSLLSVSWKPQKEGVTVGRISQIVAERTRELFDDVIREKLERELSLSRYLGAGVVITGGSALLKGLNSMVEDVFEVPVRTGLPMRMNSGGKFWDIPKRFQHPAYSAALGGLLLTLKDTSDPSPKSSWRGLNKLKQWVREVYSKW